MLSYKELEQLLRPIREEGNNISIVSNLPNNSNINQNQPNIQPQNRKQANKQSNLNNNSNAQQNQRYGNQNQNNQFQLILAHRQLRKIPAFIPFRQYPLQRLDLSFNYLKDLKPFKDIQGNQLTYINLSFNFLTSLEYLGNGFPNLKIIDINANRIQSVNLKHQQYSNLQALYLKNNKIKFFLNCPPLVQILCLDHNELEKLAFTGGQSLQILSASVNKIKQLQLDKCDNLAFIDLQNNQLHDLQKLKKILQKCGNLLSLNMIDNYVSRIAHKKYMIQALTTCPKLAKIDQVFINPHVREAFKVLNQQDKMELQMKQTEQKYRKRMEQQLKLKQQLLDKLRNEEKQIQSNFHDFIRKQKEQLDALQNYAKNNMGKKKLAISDQNKPFTQLSSNYTKNSSDPNLSGYQNQNLMLGMLSPNELANKLTQIVVQGVIEKHKEQYNQFNKSKLGIKQQKKQSKLKSYSKIPQDNNQNNQDDDDSDLSNENQLTNEQIERRKKNMRNPSLVYRNTNILIGAPQKDIEKDVNSQDQDIFNKKCLPYLVKNYGFHTVV